MLNVISVITKFLQFLLLFSARDWNFPRNATAIIFSRAESKYKPQNYLHQDGAHGVAIRPGPLPAGPGDWRGDFLVELNRPARRPPPPARLGELGRVGQLRDNGHHERSSTRAPRRRSTPPRGGAAHTLLAPRAIGEAKTW